MDIPNTRYSDTAYSSMQARILFELFTHNGCSQTEIVNILNVDKSYLSRILFQFGKSGLIEKRKNQEDKRTMHIFLTSRGEQETKDLIERTNRQLCSKIDSFSVEQCEKLCNAMNTIMEVFEKEEKL